MSINEQFEALEARIAARLLFMKRSLAIKLGIRWAKLAGE